MAQVKIQNLAKNYPNGALGLKEINLEVKSGEFVVLVGPSGCGKSTLLRCVAGLETPSSGSIEIGGMKANTLPPSKRGIGMVFQDYALYPHMTVRENLSFGLEIKKLPAQEIHARVREIATILELTLLLDRKPSQLSGGQRQRVAIGRALIRRPSVLLFDEPLSNLDPQLRTQTRIELAALHKRMKSTTLYVTHDQEEAMTLADRIVVLEQGKVQQIAPPQTLYFDPENRFVASFIGSPPMNFLDGELKIVDRKFIFIAGELQMDVSGSAHPLEPGEYSLAFRPESAGLAKEGPLAKLIWSEFHGHEIQIIAELGYQNITIRTSDPPTIALLRGSRVPERFPVQINMKQLLWFEATQEGKRIRKGLMRSVA